MLMRFGCIITMLLFINASAQAASVATGTASATIQAASSSSSDDTVTVFTDSDGTTTTAVVGNTTTVTVNTDDSTGINTPSATTTIAGDSSGNRLVSVIIEPNDATTTNDADTVKDSPISYRHTPNAQSTPSEEVVQTVRDSIKEALAQASKQENGSGQTAATAEQQTLLNKIQTVLNGNTTNGEISITPYTFTVPPEQTAIISIQSDSNNALVSQSGGQVNTIRCSGTCSLYLLSDKSTGQAQPTHVLVDHSY